MRCWYFIVSSKWYRPIANDVTGGAASATLKYQMRNCLWENVHRTHFQLVCKEQRDRLFLLLQYVLELEAYLDITLLWPERS